MRSPTEIYNTQGPFIRLRRLGYQDNEESFYVTLINKSYGDVAEAALVSVNLTKGPDAGVWERVDLTQTDDGCCHKHSRR